MPETAKKRAETHESQEAGGRVSTSAIELLAAWNFSLAHFYGRRLRKYWNYPFDVAEKRSLEGLAQWLVEFQRELLGDYSEQADELQRIVHGRRRDERGTPSREYERRLLEAQRDAASIIEQAKLQAERIVASAKARVERPTSDEEAPAEPARKRA